MDHEPIYKALASHLDRLPSGFPKTDTGIEIKILRKLFTPEEATLAQLLSMRPEKADAIAARSGMDASELSAKLQAMSQKGLIFRIARGGETSYMAAQFIIGIWEYHVNDLDPELIRLVNEYLPFYFSEINKLKTPQLRTIPIDKALPADQAVMPYEEARRIVMEQEKIIVAPCICRKEHQIMGDGCDKPMETCLVFGPGADYYEQNGIGRPIDSHEAIKILKDAERSGLVLQPSNAQKVVNICACCGCCCQILKNLKRLPNPAQYAASNYRAQVTSDLCTGCETCLERCQMEAISMVDGEAAIAKDRCIGCGLCVTTCGDRAIRLELKPEEERTTPPPNYMTIYKRIAKERISRMRDIEKG
jgi:Na+-translocating ferredoxin:NAD+ oxidoreductase subunit B